MTSGVHEETPNGAALAPTAALPENPFVGPEPLDVGQPLHGRRRETEELSNLVVAKRVVLLFSPSGAGKTSLIRAGLIRKLQHEYGMQVLPIVRLGHRDPEDPGNADVNRYRMALLRALEGMRPDSHRKSSAELAGYEVQHYFDERVFPSLELEQPRDDDGPEVKPRPKLPLLVIDQFEELFVDPLDVDRKREFLVELGNLLRKDAQSKSGDASNPEIWALFAIREDRLADLQPYLDLISTALSFRYRLDALGVDAALEVICKTGRGWIDDGVANVIVDDLCTVSVRGSDGTETPQPGPVVEPVHLQIVCRDLWDRVVLGEARILTVKDVGLHGKSEVNRALADFYNRKIADAVDGTKVTERTVREWVEMELISTSGVRTQSLFEPATFDNDDRPVRRLVDAHVLRLDKRAGRDWIELPHDRLVPPVREANHAWLTEHLQAFQARAKQWHSADADYKPLLLLTEDELKCANRYTQDHPGDITKDEREFLAASEEALLQTRKVRRYHARMKLASLVTGAVIVMGGWLWLLDQNDEKADQIDRQEKELADKARAAKQSEIYRQLSKARESGTPGEALAILLPLRERADAADPTGGQLRTIDNAIRQQLTLSPAALVRELAGLKHIIWSVFISRDGNDVFAGAWDGHISVQNLAHPKAGPFVTPDIQSGVYVVVVDDAKGVVASTHFDGRVRIWRWDGKTLKSLSTVMPPRASPRRLSSAALSDDGRWLAAGGWDRKIDVWDLEDPSKPKHLATFGKGKALQAMTFLARADHAARQRLVSTDYDGNVVVWSIGEGMSRNPSPERELAIADHVRRKVGISAAAASPSGRFFVAGDTEGFLNLWDLASGDKKGIRFTSVTHRANTQDMHVKGVAFSSDSREFVSVGVDGYLVRWTLPADAKGLQDLVRRTTTQRFKPGGRLYSVAWRPGTQHQLVVGGTRSLYLLDLDRGPGPALSTLFPDSVEKDSFKNDSVEKSAWNTVSMDATGSRIAARNGVGPIRLWERAPQGIRATTWGLQEKGAAAYAVTPDGQRLVTVDCHGQPTEWTLRLNAAPERVGAAVTAARDCDKRSAVMPIFDWEGQYLTSTDAHVLRIWKREGAGDGPWRIFASRKFERPGANEKGERVRDLISVMTFDVDRRYLAVGTSSGAVHLLEIAQLQGRGSPVESLLADCTPSSCVDIGMSVRALSFHPDGTSLRTGAADGYVTELSVPTLEEQDLSTRHERSVIGVSHARTASGEVKWITADLDGYIVESTPWPGTQNHTSNVDLTLRGGAPTQAIALSRDGSFLVTAGEDLLGWDLTASNVLATAQSYAGRSYVEPKKESRTP